MMTWNFPEQSAPKRKTDYEQVIDELARVASQLMSGKGDREALQRQRKALVQRFYNLKDFKLPD